MNSRILKNFDLDKIADSGQCFRVKKIDDSYRFVSKNKIISLKKIGKNKFIGQWDSFWEDYFDLDTDYEIINAPRGILKEALKFSSGIRILKQDPWEMLISFIISQRNSIPSIKKSIYKLCLYYGVKLSEGEYAFPTAKRLAGAKVDDLFKCSLGYRTPYVLKASQIVHANKGILDDFKCLKTSELINSLKMFKGVGDKVANCVALYGFHRLECAPVDTWIKKFLDKYYGGKNCFLECGEYAGILQQYVFYYMRYADRFR